MPNPTFRRWTADDIAKLKNMAQREPRAKVAAQLGRSVGATAVKAHQLGIDATSRRWCCRRGGYRLTRRALGGLQGSGDVR